MKLFERRMEPVVCTTCGRSNLAGGVRCVYCGIHFPAKLDFEFAFDTPAPDAGSGASPTGGVPAQTTQGGPKQARLVGWLTSIGLLILKGKSLLAVAKFGKVAVTIFSMLVSIWVYTQIYQWPFAVGFVICIFIHEMGHVFVNWRKGIPATAPMFIPFMGAVIFVKGFPDDPTSESESGAGGPVAGMLAAFACLALWYVTRNNVFLALAHTGFFINLFNMVPLFPLDGSRIGSVFSPRIWNSLLLILFLIAIKTNIHSLWLIILMGFFLRLSGSTGDPTRWVLATPIARLRMAGVFLALCLILSIGADRTLVPRPFRTDAKQSRSVIAKAPPVAGNGQASVAPNAKSSGVEANGQNPPGVQHASGSESMTEQDISLNILLIRVADILGYLEIIVPIALWLWISVLVSRVTGTPYSRRNLFLLAAMLALGAVPILYEQSALEFRRVFWNIFALRLLGNPYYLGFMAATLGALLHALVRSTILSKATRPLFESAVAHALGWALCGALLVAYAMNSLALFGCTAVLLAGYFIMNRWAWYSWCAGQFNGLGNYGRWQSCMLQAIEHSKDPLYRVATTLRMVSLQSNQDRGADLLATLDLEDSYRREVQEAVQADPKRYEVQNRLVYLEQRATGYTLTERYAQALFCCEQMLQGTPEQPVSPLNLLVVRMRLARIAFCRGWYDEALAQVDAGIRMLAEAPPNIQGRFLSMRATVHIALGDEVSAKLDCDNAQKLVRDPYMLALIGAVRAEIALNVGDLAVAQRAIKPGLHGYPANLYFLYLSGKLQQAEGKEESNKEGKEKSNEILRKLASDYPDEYWGRRAAEICSAAGNLI